MARKRSYIPALGFHRLTPLYDAVMGVTMGGASFKQRLIDLATLEDGGRALDLGCGTGTLAILLKAQRPGSGVHALDGDRAILRVARRKSERAAARVRICEAMAGALPYSEHSFDCVLISLLLHHLSSQQKTKALREAFRVLRPGGEVLIADWGVPANALMRVCFYTVQIIDGFESTADLAAGRLPAIIALAGFRDVAEMGRENTPFGTLYFYRAVRPASPAR